MAYFYFRNASVVCQQLYRLDQVQMMQINYQSLHYELIIIFINKIMSHPNVAVFQQLTIADIRAFTRDQVLDILGLIIPLNPAERQQCEWIIALLEERRDHLKARQDHAAAQTLADQRQATIVIHEATIAANNITIADYRNLSQCWKCFFLQKGRAVELILALITTILVTMLVTGLTNPENQSQKMAKLITLVVLGVLGATGGFFLIIWGWNRFYHFQHPHI